MSGTVVEKKLDTPTRRLKLKAGRQTHWRNIIRGSAHLGYRRKVGTKEGEWILRRFLGGTKYRVRALGKADDVRPADGLMVLDFAQAEATARALVDTNAPQVTGRLTVRQAMANYVLLKRQKGQPTDDLEYRADAHILPRLGDRFVSDLTTDQLQHWLFELASCPKRRGGQATLERARKASANRVFTMLRAALNHAFKRGKVASDRAWRLVEPFEDVETARVAYLQIAECQRLINASEPEFRLLVKGALLTGARYGELGRLDVSDFNRDSGTLIIRQSKSGKSRHIILTDEGVQFFKQITAGRGRSDLIFTHSGRPWKTSDQSRLMRRACKASRIDPPVGFHQLRHTWASHAVMNGMDRKIVADNLGHSTTKMVEKFYGHLSDSYRQEQIKSRGLRLDIDTTTKVTSLR
jgi:integrase